MKIEIIWSYFKYGRLHYAKIPVEISGMDEGAILRQMTVEVDEMPIMSIPFYYHEMTVGYHTICIRGSEETERMEF